MVDDDARPAGIIASREGGAAGTTGPWWCRRPKPAHLVPTGCSRVFIPIYGWLDADDDHRRTVDKRFELPMVVLSLLVLPLLFLEYLPDIAGRSGADYVGQHVIEHPATRIAMKAAIAVIYSAFLVEFAVKIAIARSRIDYVVKHWVDVVILLAPFLRAFRGLRALRAMKVVRMTRVLTLRGVVMKLVRTMLAMTLSLRVVQRLKERSARMKKADVEHDYTQWSKAALISEINRLHGEIRAMQAQNQHRRD